MWLEISAFQDPTEDNVDYFSIYDHLSNWRRFCRFDTPSSCVGFGFLVLVIRFKEKNSSSERIVTTLSQQRGLKGPKPLIPQESFGSVERDSANAVPSKYFCFSHGVRIHLATVTGVQNKYCHRFQYILSTLCVQKKKNLTRCDLAILCFIQMWNLSSSRMNKNWGYLTTNFLEFLEFLVFFCLHANAETVFKF
jgi:hypothetical protein